jgi:hypothetical protein
MVGIQKRKTDIFTAAKANISLVQSPETMNIDFQTWSFLLRYPDTTETALVIAIIYLFIYVLIYGLFSYTGSITVDISPNDISYWMIN